MRGMRHGTPMVGTFLTLVLAAAMLAGFYGGIVRSPSEILFGLQSDALKNYYTPLYHLRHDKQYWHFEGLNYPYGDHLIYADAQPALSNLMRFVSSNLIDIRPHYLAILNLVPLLLIVVAGWLVYAILARFGLPSAYAALGGVTIAFLSPQVYRLAGHYGLAYVIVIPSTWYLLLLFFESPGWRRSGLIGLSLVIWSGLHLYYLALAGLFLGLYWLSTWVWARGIDFRLLPYLSLQLLAPALAIYAFISLTDPYVYDRATPWEWRHHLSSPGAIFLPGFPPYLGSRFFPQHAAPEGIAYVTPLGAIVLLVLFMILLAKVSGRNNDGVMVSSIPSGLTAGLLAAVLALFIAFGVPLRWFESLDPVLGPLRQFRSVGRLAWIFYYVYLVFCWYLLYRVYALIQARGWRSWAAIVLATGIALPVAECLNFNYFLAGLITNRAAAITGTAPSPATAWVESLDVNDYQAIIPLPYYHLGSETYFDYPGNEASLFNSMAGSLQSGLPLVSSYLNRTALHQSRRTLGFIKGSELAQAYIGDLTNTKDFLLLVSEGQLKPEESDLVARASPLFQNEAVAVYRLPFQALAP
jgi:hypothetical protein